MSPFQRRLALRLLGAASALSFTMQGSGCGRSSATGTGARGATGGSSSVATSSSSPSSSSGRLMGDPCAGTFDCPCWRCNCQGVAKPPQGRACIDGVCPDGPTVCGPVCAGLDAGLGGSTTVICPDVAAGGAGGSGGGTSQMPVLDQCFPMPDAGGCPTNKGVALNDFLALGCPTGYEPYEILAGPTIDGGLDDDGGLSCCYSVHDILCGAGGRPYREGDVVVRAQLDRGALHGEAPARVDRALADAWTKDALAEHASIASFARFALSLMAHGAPADLVAAAHEAALDEVRHAEVCFAFASRFAGERVAPSSFPVGTDVRLDESLAELASGALLDGCVAETLAAVAASDRAEAASDAEVRLALTAIAEDEARHAELAFRVVAWAIDVGGSSVRDACAEASSKALSRAARSSARQAVIGVVAPAVRLLLRQPRREVLAT